MPIASIPNQVRPKWSDTLSALQHAMLAALPLPDTQWKAPQTHQERNFFGTGLSQTWSNTCQVRPASGRWGWTSPTPGLAQTRPESPQCRTRPDPAGSGHGAPRSDVPREFPRWSWPPVRCAQPRRTQGITFWPSLVVEENSPPPPGTLELSTATGGAVFAWAEELAQRMHACASTFLGHANA